MIGIIRKFVPLSQYLLLFFEGFENIRRVDLIASQTK